MKDISIIIVNYNVQFFLDQCIQSIYASKHELEVEILVVDNNSVDGSVDMIREKYPQVRLTANKDNPGFAVANNQAINIALGKYVLLLNPDTLLSEDTLHKCYMQMEKDEKIGALGIKMLDGKGHFLPESKRGFPDFWTAFYKMSGLSKLFPRSKKFNKYHLGNLDKDENHQIEVLSGAFMFLRKKALDEVGLLDEQFFMYGEDIDLSYRISKGGYKNYYLSESSIIHFKGESTKKTSISYTKHFYNAMAIFNKKHFSGNSFLISKFISLAILLSGFFAYFKNKILPFIAPIIDGLLIFLSLILVKIFWAKYYFQNQYYYDAIPITLLFIGFSFVYVLCLYLNGHYDEKSNFAQLMKGWLFGGLMSFLVYSFLPEEFRFSRAIIFLSFLATLFLLWISKRARNRIMTGDWSFVDSDARRVLLVGSKESVASVSPQFQNNNTNVNLIGSLSPVIDFDKTVHLGSLDSIKEIAKFENPNEIVFCSGDISNSKIFKTMSDLGGAYSYRISSQDNENIIGSDSKNRSGIWYSSNINFDINSPEKKRQKRVFDIIMCLLLVVIFPFVLIFLKNRKAILSNIIFVLFGQKTWIGYSNPYNSSMLPSIRNSVFEYRNVDAQNDKTQSPNEINLEYAQNYNVWNDFVSLLYKLMP